MTTRDGLITSEFDDAGTLDDGVALDAFGDRDPFGDLHADDIDDNIADDPEDDDWDADEEENDELDVDLELVVFDLAGTTVIADDVLERALGEALARAGIGKTPDARASALDYLRELRGQPTMAAFRALAADDEQAQHANAEFQGAYAAFTAEAGLRGVPGAEDLIRRLRSTGVRVALTSDFSRIAHNAVLAALGWQDLADVSLSAADAGRGGPYPDLPLTALLRTGASSVEGMVVVGDTASDVVSGIAAGAGLVVGVLTGVDDEDTLLAAGADAVIPSIAHLPELLGFEAHDAHEAPVPAAANALR